MLRRATGSYMRLEVIALLAALSIASTAPAQPVRSPRQTTWRGTLTTTAGLTATFIARTHLTYGRDLSTTFDGHFRCRGAGCPMHHGVISLYVEPLFFGKGSGIYALSFGMVGKTTYCGYSNYEPPPGLPVVGAYNCHSAVPQGPPPGPTLSSGTLNLAAYQNGRPVPPDFRAPDD